MKCATHTSGLPEHSPDLAVGFYSIFFGGGGLYLSELAVQCLEDQWKWKNGTIIFNVQHKLTTQTKQSRTLKIIEH
jgi:hypothetical protein